MPVLIDYSQFVIAAIFNSMKEGFSTSEVTDENVVRHLLLNHLRSNRKRFHREYGELIICCDSKDTWRKDYFPYYKIRRTMNKKKSDIDWNVLHGVMQKLKNELEAHFPYKVIQIAKCEADDIIGVICNKFGDEFLMPDEKFLILSRDKDYKQLLRYVNVKQYDQIDKKMLHVDNADKFLQEMIICGDSGDDVPNILSKDAVFALKERQKPMTQKRLDAFMSGEFDEDAKMNYMRNKTLIDLNCVPEELQEQILEAYSKETQNKRGRLLEYFIDKGLTNLLTDIGDF